MNRPAPRKSSLSGASPVTPPVSAPELEQPAPAPTPEPAAAAPAAAAPSRPTVKKAGGKYPPKVSFYQDPADTDRIRGAILHTMSMEGYRNLSQFLNQAAMEKVAELVLIHIELPERSPEGIHNVHYLVYYERLYGCNHSQCCLEGSACRRICPSDFLDTVRVHLHKPGSIRT